MSSTTNVCSCTRTRTHTRTRTRTHTRTHTRIHIHGCFVARGDVAAAAAIGVPVCGAYTNVRSHTLSRVSHSFVLFVCVRVVCQTSAGWLTHHGLMTVIRHAYAFSVYAHTAPHFFFTAPAPGVVLLIAPRTFQFSKTCVVVAC